MSEHQERDGTDPGIETNNDGEGEGCYDEAAAFGELVVKVKQEVHRSGGNTSRTQELVVQTPAQGPAVLNVGDSSLVPGPAPWNPGDSPVPGPAPWNLAPGQSPGQRGLLIACSELELSPLKKQDGSPADEGDVVRRIEEDNCWSLLENNTGPFNLEIKKFLLFLYAREFLSQSSQKKRVHAILTILKPGTEAFERLKKIV
jgi:hypothetical protein